MREWQKALIGTAVLLIVLRWTGLTEGVQRWLADQHWRWRAAIRPAPFPSDILVIAIDDATLRKFGRLAHWSRKRYGELIDVLSEARAVGLDILLVEPDRFDPQGDAALVRSVKEHGRVVVPFHIWKEARPLSTDDQRQIARLLEKLPQDQGSAPDLPSIASHLLQPPLSGLIGAVWSTGYADLNADRDGIYRQPVLVRRTADGRLVPHFTLALACLASGQSLEDALRGGFLTLPGRRIRLSSGSFLLHPFARRGGTYQQGLGTPVPQISFSDALAKGKEFFRGKICLVGETAAGTTDIRPNPIDQGLRGVELNAEILANLLFLPPVASVPGVLEWIFFGLAVGLPLWFYSVKEVRSAIGASVGLLLILIGAYEGLFWILRWVPSWTLVLTGWLGANGLMSLQRLRQEEERKRILRETFSLYVAPELVGEILRNPYQAMSEAKRQKVAILFSDLRNFTTYSEQTAPEEIVAQMRDYLTEMTEAVMRHRGVLDKFIGDAVMALFGPWLPEGAPTSALALLTARDMVTRLERLNERWVKEGKKPFRVGIGIHAGEAVVGNIGSSQRVQFTALGDTVNLASRLQTLTKDLNAVVLVSEEVKADAEPSLSGQFQFEDRGPVTVRGRGKPVRIYQVTWTEEEREVMDREAVPARQTQE